MFTKILNFIKRVPPILSIVMGGTTALLALFGGLLARRGRQRRRMGTFSR